MDEVFVCVFISALGVLNDVGYHAEPFAPPKTLNFNTEIKGTLQHLSNFFLVLKCLHSVVKKCIQYLK